MIMSVKCKISVNSNFNDKFEPGSLVIVRVTYTVEQSTQLRSIVLTVAGKSKCGWRDDSQEDEIPQYEGKEEFYRIQKDLLQNRTHEYSAGSYLSRIHFRLPKKIPPSFQCKNLLYSAFISYYVKVKFIETSCLYKSFKKEFKVQNVFTLDHHLETTELVNRNVYTFSDEDVDILSVSLQHAVIIGPGKEVKLKVQTDKEKAKKLKSVNIRFIEIIKLKDCSNNTCVKENVIETLDVLPDIKLHISENNKMDISMIKSMPVPPHALSIFGSRLVERDYKLSVNIDIIDKGLSSSINFPIIICYHKYTKPVSHENTEPPSYEEAVAQECTSRT